MGQETSGAVCAMGRTPAGPGQSALPRKRQPRKKPLLEQIEEGFAHYHDWNRLDECPMVQQSAALRSDRVRATQRV